MNHLNTLQSKFLLEKSLTRNIGKINLNIFYAWCHGLTQLLYLDPNLLTCIALISLNSL